MTRPRKLFKRRDFLLLGGFAGLAGYMRFGEPHWLEVGRHTVPPHAGAAEERPLTLLHLADFHVSGVVGLSFIREAIELGLASCAPDLICVTGDFITSTWEEWEEYAAILKLLPEAAPTCACLGNHDGGEWAKYALGYDDTSLVRKLLEKSGIALLHNRNEVIGIGGRRLNLAGLGDYWAGEMDEVSAFAGIDAALPAVLLSHNPDTKQFLGNVPWHVMLCGHTHGGQLSLPFVGTPFAPVEDKRYVAGLRAWGDRWIHVTKGVGNLYGLRFNCRPEVSVLTLR